MAKKSRKRVGRFEKDQSGCMWGLINIFDFRHGRTSQKLLPDRKHGSKRIGGAAYPEIKLEALRDTCEICKEISDAVQSRTASIDASKMSVKELMEEEMCGEQDQKRLEIVANGDEKQALSGDGGHGKKSRRWTRSKASLDFDAHGLVAAEGLVTEKPSHRKHKSLSSVDLGVVVEEFCTHIHQKDTIKVLKHGNEGELGTQPIDDCSDMEEKLWEATKMLVNHFSEGKSFHKDGKVQPSKELTDSLQILNSNKEVFLKFLQDPNSLLAKHIQSLQDIQVEEGKFKVLTGSNLSERDVGNGKQQSFFWRRFKGLDRNSSKKNESSEDLSRIVVLKPGPSNSRNTDKSTACSSLPGSTESMEDKCQIERASSSFSFSEFKRKLKHAMRKEHGVVHSGISPQPAEEQKNLANRDKKLGETVGMVSPSRDHFFIERIPKSSVGVKKVDKMSKLKDSKIHLELDTALPPEQRVSNIYAEAKKHLAEIVSNVDADMDTPGRQVPKSLGRILSYSGYGSPTACSPRNQVEMKLPPDGEHQTDDKTCQVVEENIVSTPSQGKLEPKSEPCMASDEPIHGAEVSTFHISDGLHCEESVGKTTDEPEVPTSEVDADMVTSPLVKSLKETNLMDNFSESCPLQSASTNEQVDSSSCTKCSEESWNTRSLKQETFDKNGSSSSSVASTLICSVTEKNEDLDAMSDATSRPSPISVLEPIFKEDEMSPSGMKSLNAVQPIQPRQIHFEEEILVSSGQVFSNRTGIDGDKYTFEFVKAVVQMSGLTWEELLQRSLFSDHLIDPSLIDEVDFLPDLLPCDFNLLFDLVNEVLVEISRLNFGCMLSFAKPFIRPELKGKDIFSDIWKAVEWYLKLEGPPRTLDQLVTKDLAKDWMWMDLCPDRESIGNQIQEVIFKDLTEDAILSIVASCSDIELPPLLSAEAKES